MGIVLDVRHLSTIQNIETVPIWARFRCSVSVHPSPSAKHRKNAQMGMVSMLGVCPPHHPLKHRKTAHLGTFSMLCECPPPLHPPNIETAPIWTRFRCLARVHHFFTRRTSKLCPSGHNFDARRASTTSLPARHRSHAQMRMFSMFGVSPPPHLPNLKTIAIWARF